MADIAMVVSNRYDPDPRVQKEGASLVAAGHRVRVYAFDRMQDAAAPSETLEGVEVRRLQLGRYPYGAPVAALVGMRRFLNAVRDALRADPPDVVHCHDQDTCSLGASLQGKPGRSGSPIRFVFDAHDFYWTYPLMRHGHSLPRRAASAALKLAAWGYVRRADLLVTVSEAVAAHPGYAETYRRWGAETVVVWNAPRAVATPPSLPKQFTVGYYGNVRDFVMFRWLLSAIEALPAAERPALRVAGGGVAQAQVQAFIEAEGVRLGIPVRVTGPFDMKDLGALMAECSVQFCMYALDSDNVPLTIPVKMFDAVAHGRQVIGNARTLMADFIEGHHWGWVLDEGDIAGLARALSEARKRVADRTEPLTLEPPPTWEAQAEKLVRAYARMLEQT